MSRFHINGKGVEGVDLLKKRHWPARLDIWPFLISYAAWIFTVVPYIDFTDALIVLGVISVTHILAFLFTAWSVDFKCFVQYSKVCLFTCLVQKNTCFDTGYLIFLKLCGYNLIIYIVQIIYILDHANVSLETHLVCHVNNVISNKPYYSTVNVISNNVNTFLSTWVFLQVKDIHLANTCKVTPVKFSGSKEVVPLHFRESVSFYFIECMHLFFFFCQK